MGLIPWPRINDITTTPENPPRFVQSGIADYPKKNAEKQRAGYPDLAPLISTQSANDVFKKILKEAEFMPNWEIRHTDSTSMRVEILAITPLLRFKDDVVIEVRSGANGTNEVHMRSRSRLGKSDLGANAKRIQEFFDRLKKVL